MIQAASHYYLDPFGCVKNQVDAENMMAHLNNSGWENVTDAEQADLIIVNSCGFIESAKKESINAVLEWRKLYPDKKILLAGCLSQRYAKELKGMLTEVDGFIGVTDPEMIVEEAFNLKILNEDLLKQENNRKINLNTGERPLLSMPGSAYVKISDGCDNKCSYCAIPLIRGGLVCRSIPDITEECRALIARGIKELCIIGQDIGAYAEEFSSKRGESTVRGNKEEEREAKSGLPDLLQAISEIKGDFWIRLLYIHPDHFPLEILDIIERDKRFLPYFDIPFQHASQKILAAMNRRGSSEKYLELIKTIRARLPDAVIRSTFLLGFPGETDEDFSALLDFQKKAKIDWLGCFAYSREEGTAAYSMKGQVPEKTAQTRKQLIEERQVPITEKNMDRFTDLTLDILIEEQIDNFYLGRLYCQAPDIDGAALIANSSAHNEILKLGTIVSCKVIARRGIDLEVRVIN